MFGNLNLGNLGELAQLASRAKDIQQGMKQFKEELPTLEFTGSSASGKVKVTVSGDMQVKHVELPEGTAAAALAAEVCEAFNAALVSAKMTIQDRMREISGGLDLPALF